jgi:hypothetical protein
MSPVLFKDENLTLCQNQKSNQPTSVGHFTKCPRFGHIDYGRSLSENDLYRLNFGADGLTAGKDLEARMKFLA